MSDSGAIRRALDDLVGSGPVPVSRKEDVMARISSARRRRAAAQYVLGGALVALGSLGAVRMIQPAPVGMDSVLQSPTVEPTAEPPSEKPSEKPKAKPTTAAPKLPPPPAPVKTTVAPKPRKTEPKLVTGNPLAVELYADPSYLKVKVYDGAGRLLRVELSFGDGTSTVVEPEGGCAGPVEWKQYFSHAYAPGSYAPRVTVTTGGCGAATETRTRATELTVKEPPAGNGPPKPTVSLQKAVEGALLSLSMTGADADGFVKKFWVDWGDGSPETYVGPRSLDGCRPGEPTQWQQSREHTYVEPGTYTVTVTVMSVDCDGGQGQTATATVTVTL